MIFPLRAFVVTRVTTVHKEKLEGRGRRGRRGWGEKEQRWKGGYMGMGRV